MKSLSKYFFRLQDREQILLTFSFIIVLAITALILFEEASLKYKEFEDLKLQEEGLLSILLLKPSIDRALEEQKRAQLNKSYSKQELSNQASSLADQVFPARDYRELDTDEEERYSQHRVKITFKRATYEQVNDYARLIRGKSPYMFLSEVKVTPKYPPKSKPYEKTTFDATFEVSSVEFIQK